MFRKIGVTILALACVLMLAACGCEHVWLEATCLEPATCELCGKTEGEIGEHIWQDATCTIPKVCTTCGAYEGFALGHSMSEPTCEEPATCDTCGYTEGEALGHSWLELTCITVCENCSIQDPASPGHVVNEVTCGAPQICEVCHMEVGEPADHVWLEADCSNPKHCANCTAVEGKNLGHTLADGSDGVSGICTTCGKAVEYYNVGDTLYAWTDYEIATDGSYTNPVTYLLKNRSDLTYEPYNWFKNGQLKDFMHKAKACMAFYSQGKVYYFTSYTSNNPKAVAKALANASSKYVSWKNAIYSNVSYTDVILAGSDALTDQRGYSYAAEDIYGNTLAIVNKYVGYPDDPTQTWAVSCDWKK